MIIIIKIQVTDAATIGRLQALGFGGWVPTEL
jgi:hypothetical protein